MGIIRSALCSLILTLILISSTSNAQPAPPIYTVLFTHIEDNTPGGTLGSAQSRQNYLLYRGRLIDMANLALSYGVPWSLQPDWKILRAALLYEDAALMATTNNKNFLRYLKEDRGVIIDPHSHESGGYNYTDVAHLLDSLGVGTTTVIGGHVWDPALPEFQEWDRYRVPVAGQQYPWAVWRGDILMGSGTPNHVNDPIVSGVWRPKDRDHYFEHDAAANIAAVGQYRGTLEGIAELVGLYQTGVVPVDVMLTTSLSIRPSTLIAPGGIATVEDSVIVPLAAMRDNGTIVPTDFTSLIQTWQTSFGSRGFLYDAEATSGIASNAPIPPGVRLEQCSPNPFVSAAVVSYSVRQETWIRLTAFDVLGRQVAVLVNEMKSPGRHAVTWDASGLAGGTYFMRLEERGSRGGSGMQNMKVVLLR